MEYRTATLEDCLAVSYKAKHTLTIQPSNCGPWYLPKEVESYVHTKTCTQMFIATVFIIAPNVEANKTAFSWGKDKETVVHQDNRTLSSAKKKQTIKL